MPGPRIDLEIELAAWFDTHLRGRGRRTTTGCDVFVRSSHPARARPRPARGLLGHGCRQRAAGPPRRPLPLAGPRSLAVDPSTSGPPPGSTAPATCRGGCRGDQRLDDARSLTWDADAAGRPGRRPPRASGCGSAPTRPAASLSVKLCDVFPDGTSALVARGTARPRLPRRRARRAVAADAGRGVRRRGRPRRLRLRVGARPAAAGQRRRRGLAQHRRSAGAGDAHRPRRRRWSCRCWTGSLARADLHSRRRALLGVGRGRRLVGHRRRAAPGSPRPGPRSESTYDAPYDGTAREDYLGEVWVDRRTFEQRADATTRSTLAWPGIDIEVVSTLTVRFEDGEVHATSHTVASENGVVVSDRTYQQVST